ncbi:hypothetical protein BDV25DRAFT_32417 [Aspergillus avenaceus]|uniref:Uncharacterized protein n=1 Tax=Aspergillus avenaceus TaxID=36643 RepID=A0A5N6TMH7_ASPAV|nr:hypothetical protein BDV25DRAFT_32417 [Aspergillus avenaceus]
MPPPSMIQIAALLFHYAMTLLSYFVTLYNLIYSVSVHPYFATDGLVAIRLSLGSHILTCKKCFRRTPYRDAGLISYPPAQTSPFTLFWSYCFLFLFGQHSRYLLKVLDCFNTNFTFSASPMCVYCCC